jgi:hemoglobin
MEDSKAVETTRPTEPATPASMYDRVGGEPALRKFVTEFHHAALADPLLGPVFRYGRPDHVDHLVLFFTEMFGGPPVYTPLGGTAAMLRAHTGLAVTEEQRQRFVEVMLDAADRTGLCADAAIRQRFAVHLAKGSYFAVKFSQPGFPTPDGPFPPIQPWSW